MECTTVIPTERVLTLLLRMQKTEDYGDWRTYEIQIQRLLIDHPLIYTGYLRQRVKTQFEQLRARRKAKNVRV